MEKQKSRNDVQVVKFSENLQILCLLKKTYFRETFTFNELVPHCVWNELTNKINLQHVLHWVLSQAMRLCLSSTVLKCLV